VTQGSPYRLPRSVIPSRYGIELQLDPASSTFDGTEDISITVHEPITEIVLNGKEITVRAGAVVSPDESVIEVAKARSSCRVSSRRATTSCDWTSPAS
jgi:puromycin-sensitive aminopeptidase